MDMAAINDSLKNVAKAAEMIKNYLDIGDINRDILLTTALDLLETTVQRLAEASTRST